MTSAAQKLRNLQNWLIEETLSVPDAEIMRDCDPEEVRRQAEADFAAAEARVKSGIERPSRRIGS